MHRFGVVAAMVAVLMVQGCFKSGDDTKKAAAASSQQSSSVSSLSSSSSSLQSSQASSSSETDQSVSSPNGIASSAAGVPVPPNSASSSSAVAGAVVRSVALSVGLEELPEGNTTNAEITATYSDGKTKKIPFGFQWIIGNPNIVTADGTRLKAKAEGTTTVQAVVNGKRSPVKRITVYKEIHGHRLPPEPDEQLNNSTLLGIDRNFNGVRDDVERWIYLNYTNPAEIGTFMQSAKAYQIVIQDPYKAKETTRYEDAAADCESYWRFKAKDNNESVWIEEYREYSKEILPVQFNTEKRWNAYDQYNYNLSGGVYGSSNPDTWKEKCDFNISNMIGN